MKIIIDADGCPVTKLTLEIAKDKNIKVILISNTCHLFDLQNYENAKHILADKGQNSADFLILNKTQKYDIVITQDYALASMCLSKQCYVINQNGFLYTNQNIDELLFRRYISKKLRNMGKNDFKNKKISKKNDEEFKKNLLNLINLVKTKN